MHDLIAILGDRQIVIAREMTKVFEEMIRGSISQVITMLADKSIKGEVTIVVSGPALRSEAPFIDSAGELW